MWWIDNLFRSGNKDSCHLTADTARELDRAAERLRAEIHGKGLQPKHLDLNQHQRDLAIRYGAQQRTGGEGWF